MSRFEKCFNSWIIDVDARAKTASFMISEKGVNSIKAFGGLSLKKGFEGFDSSKYLAYPIPLER